MTGTSWRLRAKCAPDDPAINPSPVFFSTKREDWREAKKVCAECPVRRQCLSTALELDEVWGVWGGNDQYELRNALALDKDGKPKATPTSKVKCPYCKSKDLVTLEKRRVKAHVECNVCAFKWWRRRIGTLPPKRKEPKVVKPQGNVGRTV